MTPGIRKKIDTVKLNSKFFSLVLECITNQKPNLNQNLFCSFLLKKQGRKNFSGGFNIKPQLKMGHPVHFLYLLLHIIINVTFLKKKNECNHLTFTQTKHCCTRFFVQWTFLLEQPTIAPAWAAKPHVSVRANQKLEAKYKTVRSWMTKSKSL